jgi:hypothetical protein
MASSYSAWLWLVSAAEGEIPQGGELGLDPIQPTLVVGGVPLACQSTGMPGPPCRELSPVLCS